MIEQLVTLPTRITSKIHIRENGCWEWTGAISKKTADGRGSAGYGRVRICVNGKAGHVYAHRYVYEALIGAVPDRLQLDHLCCKVGQCAGGDDCPHRRWREMTHCYDGHPFDEANTRINPRDGRRICRKCDAIRARGYRAQAYA